MKRGAKSWIACNFDVPENNASKVDKEIQKPTEFKIVRVDKTPETKVSSCFGTVGTNVKELPFNFLEKVTPKTIEDLAVHLKKIKEVELWLKENVLNSKQEQSYAPMLLLTGPTGSGKTVTVTTLCKTLNIKVMEWVNPVNESPEFNFRETQMEKFLDFFTQSKYGSLTLSTNSKQVVLVEDFPNFIVHCPAEFITILERCYTGTTPSIFICTDASNSKLNLSQSLFTQDVRQKFQITNISFNPCSATLLKSALKRALQETQPYLSVSTDVIEAIISSCMGDIRCAINQLNFASLKASGVTTAIEITKKKGVKRKRKEKSVTINFMLKNETLSFFHGLGRVLNPKRIETENSWRIDCNIETLIDQFGTQPSIFNSFLQENYLKYFGDLQDIHRAASILSEAQLFLEKWTDYQDVLIYALWVSVLGLMIFNEHKISKWNQIQAPTKVNSKILDLEVRYLDRSDLQYYNIITKSHKYEVLKV